MSSKFMVSCSKALDASYRFLRLRPKIKEKLHESHIGVQLKDVYAGLGKNSGKRHIPARRKLPGNSWLLFQIDEFYSQNKAFSDGAPVTNHRNTVQSADSRHNIHKRPPTQMEGEANPLSQQTLQGLQPLQKSEPFRVVSQPWDRG